MFYNHGYNCGHCHVYVFIFIIVLSCITIVIMIVLIFIIIIIIIIICDRVHDSCSRRFAWAAAGGRACFHWVAALSSGVPCEASVHLRRFADGVTIWAAGPPVGPALTWAVFSTSSASVSRRLALVRRCVSFRPVRCPNCRKGAAAAQVVELALALT